MWGGGVVYRRVGCSLSSVVILCGISVFLSVVSLCVFCLFTYLFALLAL